MVSEWEIGCSNLRGCVMPWCSIFSHRGCYVYVPVWSLHVRGGVGGGFGWGCLLFDIHCYVTLYYLKLLE